MPAEAYAANTRRYSEALERWQTIQPPMHQLIDALRTAEPHVEHVDIGMRVLLWKALTALLELEWHVNTHIWSMTRVLDDLARHYAPLPEED